MCNAGLTSDHLLLEQAARLRHHTPWPRRLKPATGLGPPPQLPCCREDGATTRQSVLPSNTTTNTTARLP